MLPFGGDGTRGGGESVTWTRRQAMAVLIGSNVLWAASYAAGKEALLTISPIELNLLRFSVATSPFCRCSGVRGTASRSSESASLVWSQSASAIRVQQGPRVHRLEAGDRIG